MNVKRYIADDVSEAMKLVKEELGVDAVILHTRKIKKAGLFGFLKKPSVEVVAAVEEKYVEEKKEEEKVEEQAERKEEQIEVKEEKNEDIDNLKKEVSEIKKMLESLSKENTKIVEKEEENSYEDSILNYLKNLDLSDVVVQNVLNVAKRQVKITEENDAIVKSTIREALKNYLGEPYTIDPISDGQRVFLFVGPTGVGKTTTIAKLAAKLSLVDNKKVAFITADTYRIAAVDQLKTYSEILGIPLTVIYESSDVKEAIYKYSDKDIILIDTAGRSHKDKEIVTDTQELINNIENPNIFLVISMVTRYEDIKNILSAYDFIDNYNLIFTKLDEASSFSNIVNAKVYSKRALSYLTTGQSVPDDIEIAEKDKIIDYIIGDFK